MKALHIYRHILLWTVFFFLSMPVIHAQDFIDEDFLEKIESNAQPLWNESVPAFTNNQVPAKYQKESAVVLGYRRMVNIDKQSRLNFWKGVQSNLIFIENVRFKIRVHDKNAVDVFSTIFFRYRDKTDGFSARLIKANGEKVAISLNEAVQVDASASIPEFFQSFFDQELGTQGQYYKVAIPDLEPGDILEYVTSTRNKLDVRGSGYIEFSPQYEVCSKGYPILFNQIIMETDSKSYFKSMSFSGAPEFKQENSNEEGIYRYVFTDTDRATEKDVHFINAYTHYPLVKFQVIYSNSDNVKGALIGSKGQIKTGFSMEELAKRAWEDFMQEGRQMYAQFMTVNKVGEILWNEMKRSGAKDWSEQEFIEKSYYKVRNLVVNRDAYFSDIRAAYLFRYLLMERNVKSDLCISISNKVGSIKDVLFDQEIKYIVKINDKLYFNSTDHSNPGELIESLLGCEAYIINAPDKKGNQEIIPYKLPASSPEQNLSSYDITASLMPDKKTLAVKRVSTYKGINKNRAIDDALRYTTYMLDDYKNYGGETPGENLTGKAEENFDNTIRTLKEFYKKEKPEFVKRQLQGDYGQSVTSKSFTLQSGGRSRKNPDLIFTEEFELGNRVRKAGKRLLVNINSLVGGQLHIKKDENERQHDISLGYPRTLQWVIRFTIPDGYDVQGVSELNQNIDNEAGTFNLVAEQKGQLVEITIRKIYKQKDLPKSSWNNLVSFVDAAYKSAFKYVLLVPKA